MPVPIINDTIAEGTEEFFANLDNVDPNDVNLDEDIATIMIIDNDGVSVCVYVCVCVCVVHVFVHARVYACIHVYVCVCVCTFTCAHE